MEQIYSKKSRKMTQINFLEAARLEECGADPVVLCLDDETGMYEKMTIKEFVEDCLFFRQS